MAQIKIVYLGTPEFAVPILEKLIQSEYKPIAVFCAPDKPVGRKQILTLPPIKVIAQKNNIPIYQPENISSFKSQIKSINPDLIICAAYGLILPKDVLAAPKFGCLNIHPSVLPKYRGPSPIQYAILNGDKETGITIIKMNEKIDAGPIVACRILEIADQKLFAPNLSASLSNLGADLLIETLPAWLAGKIKLTPQDESQTTYTKIIKKEDGLINWRKSAQEIERQIRAFTPWPGTYANLKIKNKKLKIKLLEAEILEKNTEKAIGEFFLAENSLAIQTGKDALIIKSLQLEGSKPMNVQDFLHGHEEIIGQCLT